jgi:carboxymethylenebutenolidase
MTERGGASAGLLGLAGVVVGLALAWSLPISRSPFRVAGSPITTHGEWVFIRSPSGDSLRAYVGYPERKDKAPAIIVIHEIFGLTNWEPSVVDRLAGAGYVAIVPDLLSPRFGATPADPDSGRKLTALLEADAVNAYLDATFSYLNGLPAVRKDAIATIGFCWGGGRSFRYATANPALKAAVVCYGPPPDPTAMKSIRASILGVYGEDDARIDDSLPAVERQMKAAGAKFSYDIYPGTGHGFLKPGRRGSDGPQVQRAWDRILKFYAENLK